MQSALPCYEVYAIRYATHARNARHNFVQLPDGHDDGAMPLDYFVWLIKDASRAIVVDTGFGAAQAAARGRSLQRPPEEGLARLGVAADTVRDVILTHLHYDHAGNLDTYPSAQFHVQEREMAFATGRYMCQPFLRLAYAADDVRAMVARLFDGRVKFWDGDAEFAPGIWLHHVGGHTAGLQIVRVNTTQGWLVLASDAFHFYANRELRAPFPIVYHAGEMLDGFARAAALASDAALIVPGHDPLVGQRFAPDPRDPKFTVRLDHPLRTPVAAAGRSSD